MQTITVEELKAKMDNQDDFLLLDVREDYEYNEFNLEGKLIPLGFLAEQMDDISDYKTKEVVIMCRSGKRSGVAQHVLINSGFENVFNLTGGALAWVDKFGS